MAVTPDDTLAGSYGKPDPEDEGKQELASSQTPVQTSVQTSLEQHVAVNVEQKQQALKQASETLSKYTIKKGQNLSDIAAELLGSPTRWRELWERNKHVIPDPNHVREGIVIVWDRVKDQVRPTAITPTTVAASATTVTPASGTSYVVSPGDTLYSIALRELGTPRRWKEIQELNGLRSTHLTRNQRLRLPPR